MSYSDGLLRLAKKADKRQVLNLNRWLVQMLYSRLTLDHSGNGW
ncbi:MAG: hypothetical protein WBE13_20675 [Candidatus Acidiferrum sp.]